MATWQAGLILLAAIVVLWALFAGAAKLVRLIAKRDTPPRLTGSADQFPSHSKSHGRWPDDTGR